MTSLDHIGADDLRHTLRSGASWPSVAIAVVAQVLIVSAYFTGATTAAVAFTVLALQLIAGLVGVSVECRRRGVRS